MKDFLIRYRKENGLTQAELAKRLSTSQQSICRLEKGNINPSLNFVKDILNKLGYELKKIKKGE